MGKMPWADRERRRFRKRGGRLLAGLAAYISRIEACSSEADLPAAMKAGRKLRKDLLRFADAQFDFTGTTHPFGRLYESDDGSDNLSLNGLSPSRPVSILLRIDFDASAMQAGSGAVQVDDTVQNNLRIVLEDLRGLVVMTRESDDMLQPVGIYAFLGTGNPVVAQDGSMGPDDVFNAGFDVLYADESHFLQ